MERDLALMIPEIIVLLTVVFALIAEMIRLPRLALVVTVTGLLLATEKAQRVAGCYCRTGRRAGLGCASDDRGGTRSGAEQRLGHIARAPASSGGVAPS